MITVRIPSPLRRLAEDHRNIDVDGDTVDAALRGAVARYPALGPALLGPGDTTPTCNIYVNGTDIRRLDGLATPVADGDTIVVLLAMGGGAPSSHAGRLPAPQPGHGDLRSG